MNTRPEITFRECDRTRWTSGQPLGAWDALPLQPVIGPRREVPSRRIILTVYEQPDGAFTWKTLGAHRGGGGNRYHEAPSLAEAQTRIQAWAKRVYRVATDDEVRNPDPKVMVWR